ncbi:SIMPL domain-containing protein [Sutcliffiella horikoshii]|uniref:SIMPL domain-containing protein n=1 Tax=Sutcliffiella horikoshii TaxID=79883 RepID=UPI001CFCF6A8|nr:SIMPL domain-containing protein [Sutcliffiella horikoshii]
MVVILQRTMLVQGNAKKEVQPDIAYLQLGVLTTNSDVQRAQEENRLIANRMIRGLIAAGIPQEDIETSSYTSFPRYETDSSGKSVLSTYEVRHIFRIKVRDITKTGTVVDVAFENGANISESVSFEVSNYKEIYRHVLQLAVVDGAKKAQAMAITLQVCLSPVPIKVEEVTQQVFAGPRYASFAVQEKESTPIEPQEITISASVNLEYIY